MQGVALFSGLQEEHVYLMFLRCLSVTAATALSSKSTSMVTISNADFGHFSTHLRQPSHFSALMIM
ncbi:MAG: hypothetical protein NWE94_09205 [Candidatus Bathyarchaeota archaeon]|nr:hypothetical protein [Candidatus Bathyarchaeota archaeon]